MEGQWQDFNMIPSCFLSSKASDNQIFIKNMETPVRQCEDAKLNTSNPSVSKFNDNNLIKSLRTGSEHHGYYGDKVERDSSIVYQSLSKKSNHEIKTLKKFKVKIDAEEMEQRNEVDRNISLRCSISSASILTLNFLRVLISWFDFFERDW